MDRVTVLQAPLGFTTAKVVRPGKVQQYNAGEWFAAQSIVVSDIYDLAALLEEISQPEQRMLVIRGELEAGKTSPVQRRKTWFRAAGRRWICCDFDSVEVDRDPASDPEGAACEVVERYLPECFVGASFYWQYSSRACLDGDRRARLHAWFWLDRPIGDDEASAWAEAQAPEVDASVFRVVQPHYVARPVFEGVQDPLGARRSGLWRGRRDVVTFPDPESYERASAVRSVRTYEDRLAELGDGDGLGGFHAVLLGGIWTYLARGGRDLEWLKTDLRRRIAEAPAGAGREGDIERYSSEAYLDDSISGAKKKLEEQRRGLRLTRESLKPFADRVARKANDREAELGRAMKAACDGNEFPAHLVPRVMVTLAERFDEVNPESLRPVFGPSAQLMRASMDDMIRDFSAAQEEVRQRALFRDEESSSRIRESFGNGRDYPYTPAELALMAKNRWVLQRAKSYYFQHRDGYRGPFVTEEMQNAAVVHLAPAPVELFKLDSKGAIVQKSPTELVREYGTVIDRVVADMRAQKSVYDEKTRTLTEATCPLRRIVPTFHPEIQEWLEITAGDKVLELCAWISQVTNLNRICVALFLTGPKGAGKSLLALGLSRLWTTTGPTALENVFANFNEELARCPLCFADEKLPTDFRGWTKNAELRIHIQETERAYKRKHLPNTKLIGATRTIVASNNEDALATSENLTTNDIDAIAARYLHIQVPQAAHDYLKQIDTWKNAWVEGDKIAEHALYLRDHFGWEPEGRFLINVDGSSLQASLTTKTGWKSSVCQWLVSYLQDPAMFHADAKSQMFVRKKGGKLLVNVRGILRCWDLYLRNEKCPPTGVLSRALEGLCLPVDKRLMYLDSRGNRTAYRIVDLQYLSRWAIDKGFVTDESEIYDLVLLDSESHVMTLAN